MLRAMNPYRVKPLLALAALLAVIMRDVLRYRVRVARDNLSKALPASV